VLAGSILLALTMAGLSLPVVRSGEDTAQAASRSVAATAVPPQLPALTLGPSGAAPSPAATTPPPPAPAGPQPAAMSGPLPAPPEAPVRVVVPLADHAQARVEQALDSLDYAWQELGWNLRFVPYTGGLLGLADPATRQITIFVKASSTVQQLRVVLAHEIAHALDVAVPEQRPRYRELRGISADLPWFSCAYCEDYDSPAGDFAEVFAAWLVGATDFRSRVAPLPDAGQFSRLAPLFAPPSARVGPPPPPAASPSPSPSPSPSRSRGLLGIGPG
jgi:hypothetical protein